MFDDIAMSVGLPSPEKVSNYDGKFPKIESIAVFLDYSKTKKLFYFLQKYIEDRPCKSGKKVPQNPLMNPSVPRKSSIF